MAEVVVSTQYGAGVATADHAAGRHGLPVVVVGGVAYGPAEAGPVNLPPYGPECHDLAAAHQSLLAAGYEVYA